MSCSPYNLKDYILGELSETEREQVLAHAQSCPACREELERLRVTHAALRALPEEEMPRRIGFVSDPIFERTSWWRWLWQSGPRLAFASAAMLTFGLVFHAAYRPPAVAVAAQTTAAIEARISEEVSKRVGHAVQTAVAESEARQAQKAQALVTAAQKDFEQQRQADRAAVAETLSYIQKKFNQLYVSANYGGQP